MTDDPPPIAAAVAETVFGEDAIRGWERLRSGGISSIWRVRGAGPTGASTVIVKLTVELAADPGFLHREALTYSEVLPKIGVRTPQLLASASGEAAHCIALEDLGGDYRFPGESHRWTLADVACLIPAYARLHVDGADVGHRPWMLGYQTPAWTRESVAADAEDLTRRRVWGPLAGIDDLAQRALDELPVLEGMSTVLHLDVYPPNVGLRRQAPRRAALIDWDMTGWGAPEFDLAYLDLQPFGATTGLERTGLLDLYWRERAKLQGSAPGADERADRQHAADRVFALSLVSAAHRSVVRPYPPASRPERYWSAMRPVLHRKLAGLLGR